MKKSLSCPACGESYQVDIEKFGGKKIRCKNCPGTITVPHGTELVEDFEVVQEESVSPSPRPPASESVGVPSSVLNRYRTASRQGAVNIALLQRAEKSREVIRENFLALHGSEAMRSAGIAELQREVLDKTTSLQQLRQTTSEFERSLATGVGLEEAFQAAQSLIDAPGDGRSGERGASSILESIFSALSSSHKTYSEQLSKGDGLLAKPFRTFMSEGQAALAMFRKSLTREGQAEAFAQAAERFGKLAGSIQQKRAARDAAQRELVQRAVDALRRAQEKLELEIGVADNKAKALIDDGRMKLQAAESHIVMGRFAEAVDILQLLVKNAPVDVLGQVLVALSKCAYHGGNAADAARQIQDAICFGASSPAGMDSDYYGLWAKANAGLPQV